MMSFPKEEYLKRLDNIHKKLENENIDAIVTNIGPPNVNDTTSAKGNSLSPMNNAMIAAAPDSALKA